MTVHLSTNIAHRNGRDYLDISDVYTSFDASYFHIDFKCQNSTPLLNDLVNRLANANWKICKLMIYISVDKYITEIMNSMVEPIIIDLLFMISTAVEPVNNGTYLERNTCYLQTIELSRRNPEHFNL